MGSSRLLFLFCSILPLFVANLSLGADQFFQDSCVNTAGNYTANSTYQANLNTIFSQLTSQTDFNYGFYNLSAGHNSNLVNAVALCRGDTNQDDCNTCLNETVSELRQRCPLYKEVVGWSEFCTLRYANRDLFGELETSPGSCLLNTQDVTDADRFNQALDNLLTNLSSRAAAGGPLRKYAADSSTVGVFQTVYAMVQCSPDLSEQECGDCLSVAKDGIGGCCFGKRGCRILRPSCLLRYESDPFYQTPLPLPSPPPSPPPPPPRPQSTRGNGNNTTRIIIVVASVVGILVLLVTSICIFQRTRKTRQHLLATDDDEVIRNDSLQFDFATVGAATNNFSDANKLGQGGFGAVYKGVLPDGQEAVCTGRNARQYEQSCGNLWLYGTRICHARPVLGEIRRFQFWCDRFGNPKWSEKQLLPRWGNRGGPNKLCVEILETGDGDEPDRSDTERRFSVSLPMPSQPAFFMNSNIDSDMSFSMVSESNQSKSEEIPVSQNEASITDLYPR
ncbi:hypothetical protein V6N12_063009 [Hibiscus sabdariffa]|uniref:Gnk2-homologous domain-containing protein n=1 Tax=Hibiscus sabdariffa TaxID=183260 RepID=A0ABR2FAR2_9ROSI